MERLIHLEVRNPNINPTPSRSGKSGLTRFNRRRCDWKRTLVLHTRVISASFFRKEDLAHTETTTNRARAYEIPQNVRHSKSLGLGLFGRACESRILNHSPSTSPVRSSHRLDKEWRTERSGGRESASIMGIGFKSTTLRRCRETKTFIIRERARLFVSPASARIASAVAVACENKPRSGANITAMGIFLSFPTRVSIQSSKFLSLILSSLRTPSNIFSRRCLLLRNLDDEYFVKS